MDQPDTQSEDDDGDEALKDQVRRLMSQLTQSIGATTGQSACRILDVSSSAYSRYKNGSMPPEKTFEGMLSKAVSKGKLTEQEKESLLATYRAISSGQPSAEDDGHTQAAKNPPGSGQSTPPRTAPARRPTRRQVAAGIALVAVIVGVCAGLYTYNESSSGHHSASAAKPSRQPSQQPTAASPKPTPSRPRPGTSLAGAQPGKTPDSTPSPDPTDPPTGQPTKTASPQKSLPPPVKVCDRYQVTARDLHARTPDGAKTGMQWSKGAKLTILHRAGPAGHRYWEAVSDNDPARTDSNLRGWMDPSPKWSKRLCS
jgi:hypothetical protein